MPARPVSAVVSAIAISSLLASPCGCARGHGGGHGGSAPHGAASANHARQWQTAMAALAQGGANDPVGFSTAGLSAFNDLVARNWPRLEPVFRALVEAELRANIPAQHLGGLSVLQLQRLRFDATQPPALAAHGGAARQTLEIQLPGQGGWRLEADLTLGGTVPVVIGSVQSSITVQLSATVQVDDIRLVLPAEIDLTNPRRPELVRAGTPSIQLQLRFSSPDPLLSQILPQATQLLDPVVRLGLAAGAVYARQWIVGYLANGLPNGRDWGRGGPALAPPTGAIDLEQAAERTFARQMREHMPFGNVYPAVADQPHTGGSIIGWRHHGDSALWSGVWLATAAYRQELTGRRDAMAKMREVVRYYDVMTRVCAPHVGLLARTAMPASSPHAQAVLRKSTSWTQVVDGTRYAAIGDTSRDSYTGTFFGLGQAYLRVPELRAEIAPTITRMLDDLERNDWMVYQAPLQANVLAGGGQPGISVTFAQAPMQVANLATVGALVDPARWSGLKARTRGLTDIMWLNSWVSAHEVHTGYFGFNLAHLHILSAVELETDPTLYRGYLRTLRILRETIGHHHNAAFDAVHAIAIPSAAAYERPRVQSELELQSQRPIRGFRIVNSQDPSIPNTIYTTTFPNQSGAPGQPIQTGPRSWRVALYPVPIPKRPSDGYIWSSSPFELDGDVDPREQHVTQDLTLPYWIARSHGVLP